ncbi:MAG: hypothetical protein ACSHXH_14300 [Marivita sp.]|uniref:hypothetical protein n=1 Tax=Marivita sp. TaxID=2003365 RepID=UPI003EF733CE
MTEPTERPGVPTVFHEKRTYRVRRVMDAARVAPVLALALWLLPLVWPQTGVNTVSSATALIYIFGVWAGIIVLTWGLSRYLDDPSDPDP